MSTPPKPIWSLTQPNVSSPVLVEVPHAGTWFPSGIEPPMQVAPENAWRDADLYVDTLYADAPTSGAALLVAHVSRYVVDLNRSEDDIDQCVVPAHPNPKRDQPRGVVWRIDTEGRLLQGGPLSMDMFEARLNQFYRPYHRVLQHSLGQIRARFGFVTLVAAHSMPSQGRSGHVDTGARRADVVPGTLGKTSASRALIDLVESHFVAAGLSVRHDVPYRGGFVTAHYGRPQEGMHAIQIELNRALYMDESTGEKKTEAFNALRQLLQSLIKKLADAKP